MINCLIVDDEPIARDIIAGYCDAMPALRIVARCGNALEAKEALQHHSVDIIFLDINLPVLDGIAFLRTLKTPPPVIFTTAYKEYAVNAFDLSACDYLVKPFSFERFIVAIDKAMEKLNGIATVSGQMPASVQEDAVFIKSDRKVFKVNYADILFAEAKGNYTRVVTENNTLLTGMSFSVFESVLPKKRFLRIHRSFIINQSKITHFEGNMVYLNKHEISIGNSYKDGFLKALGLQ
jgi:DNA-binding LytR/AlgR family response regulator